ncbi:MAG: hypothetical protein OCC49_18200 [Fibrobacterales bacterium]
MIQQNKSARLAQKKKGSAGIKRETSKRVVQTQKSVSSNTDRGNAIEKVYGLLKTLSDSYMLFRECEVNGVPFDFLIVSANGISVVGVSGHTGAVSNNEQDLYYDGEKTDKREVSRLWSQTSALKSMINEVTGIDYFVKTIICYPDAFVAVQVPIDETAVINGTFLCPMVRANRTVIPEKHLRDIIGSVAVR